MKIEPLIHTDANPTKNTRRVKKRLEILLNNTFLFTNGCFLQKFNNTSTKFR